MTARDRVRLVAVGTMAVFAALWVAFGPDTLSSRDLITQVNAACAPISAAVTPGSDPTDAQLSALATTTLAASETLAKLSPRAGMAQRGPMRRLAQSVSRAGYAMDARNLSTAATEYALAQDDAAALSAACPAPLTGTQVGRIKARRAGG